MGRRSAEVRKTILFGASLFCVAILAISVLINIKNYNDQKSILEDSICSQLMSVSVAAREIICEEEYDFAGWNSMDDVVGDWENYTRLRNKLRDLVMETDVEYVYALKYIDGEYQFVMDTDPDDEQVFIPYEVSRIHLDAFAGKGSAGVMNVQDEYGTFNTAAVPIIEDGVILGIVCVDVSDLYLQKSDSAARINFILLVTALVAAMGVMLYFMLVLMKRLRKAQAELDHRAYYDVVTDLPNRQYLFDVLKSISEGKNAAPYALMFIDLDNFKVVNDKAGHDVGDELLHFVGEFLQSQFKNSKAFRPAAGLLNVSARVGGDEFIQIVPGIADVESAEAVAKQLIETFTLENSNRFVEKYRVGMSVGVALFPMHTRNYQALIKYADIAMYHAKLAEKNTYRIYKEEMAPKDEK